MVLKKSFLGDERNFSGPLTRFASRDVRDHILSHKIDNGSSYWSQRALQRRRPPKIDIREIFGEDRFSTFATISAMNGLMHRRNNSSIRSPLRRGRAANSGP